MRNHDDGCGNVELIRDEHYANAWLLRIGATDQSYVDLDDPTRLEFDYIAKMAMVIDAVHPGTASLRVIHIGGAAMTLPRYIAITRPRSSQIVLEPDIQLTDYVRQNIPLRPRSGIRVRPQSGDTGIAQMPEDYADVVIVDAFAGAQVPAELGTAEFFADTARVMRPGGVLIGNYPDKPGHRYWGHVLAGLRAQWQCIGLGAEPGVLKGRRFGNALFIASQRPLPTSALARRTASSPLPYRFTEHVAQVAPKIEAFKAGDSQLSPYPNELFR